MDWVEQLVLILGLSMDGFAAAVCMGTEDKNRRHRIFAALCLTTAHMAMLTTGWVLGAVGHCYTGDSAAPLGAAVLFVMGVDMLLSAEKDAGYGELTLRRTILISGAASVDALTVGAVLSLSGVGLFLPCVMTLLVVGVLSLVGVILGNRIGQRWHQRVKQLGGIALCIMGARMLF